MQGSLDFPEPQPLEGIKSKKTPIFNVSEAEVVVGTELRQVKGIKLSLSSRIMAVGEGGLAIAGLLKEEAQVSSGETWRQAELNVVHLAPQELSDHLVAEDFVGAINAAMQARPQVVIVDECLALQNSAWAQAFSMVLNSNAFSAFGGAIVVLCSDETLSVSRFCPETWMLLGKSVQSVASLETYDVTDHCSGEKEVELDADTQFLLDQALAIEYCSLKHYMDKVPNQPCRIKLFASTDTDGQKSLRGFMCHEMLEGLGEFHIRFVFVPKEHRCGGIGGRLMRWALNSARRMPKSQCKWVSLEAADEDLVTYYERFGFCDFGGENEDGNTWMEVANESIVVDDECLSDDE
jgi:GNAT superfamily N-acetyltransferase